MDHLQYSSYNRNVFLKDVSTYTDIRINLYVYNFFLIFFIQKLIDNAMLSKIQIFLRNLRKPIPIDVGTYFLEIRLVWDNESARLQDVSKTEDRDKERTGVYKGLHRVDIGFSGCDGEQNSNQ